MKKHLFFVLYLTLMSSAVSAQITEIQRDAEDKVLTIVPGLAGNAKVLSLLKNCQGPEKLEFNIKEHHEIYQNNDKIIAKVAVGNIIRVGDYSYKQFSVNHLLIPTRMAYTYHLENNGKDIEHKTIANTAFKSGDYTVNLKTEAFQNTENCKIYLSKLQLAYADKDAKTLQEFTETVDAYYNADATLRMMARALDDMQMDSLELLQKYLQRTEANIEKINQIEAQRFFSKLDLDASDPISFKHNLGSTKVKNREKKEALQYKLKNMHETLYLKGMDWLNWKDTSKAQDYFHQAISHKGNYAPPYLEIARYAYTQKDYFASIDTCAQIIARMNPDTDTRYSTIKLAEKVIYHFFDSVYYLIEHQQFNEGMALLQKCSFYANNMKGIRKFQEFEEINQKISLIYYTQLADAAEEKLQNQQLKEGQTLIDSLATFRQEHKEHITDASREQTLQNNLYQQWMNRGEQGLKNSQPDTAAQAFQTAKNICLRYDAVQCSPSLDSLLRQADQLYYLQLIQSAKNLLQEELGDSCVHTLLLAETIRAKWQLAQSPSYQDLLQEAYALNYQELITAGDEALNVLQAREALAYYSEAEDISTKAAFDRDTTLPRKTVEAASLVIHEFCQHAQSFIETMEMDKARQYLNKALAFRSQYSLEQVSVVNEDINHLKEALRSGKCNEVQFAYNVKFRAAEKFIEQGEFIYATKALKEAIAIAQSDNDCPLNKENAEQLQGKIRPVKHYQEESEGIEKAINDKNFKEALTRYEKLSRFYKDSISYRYGIQHDSTFIFIKYHKDQLLKDYAVSYYAESGQYHKSLEMLYLLHKLDYSAKWSKESQITLGKQLALLDFEKQEDQDAEQAVQSYTKGDKWFKYLKKAYLEQWEQF